MGTKLERQRRGPALQDQGRVQLRHDLCGGGGFKDPETRMANTAPYVLIEYIFDDDDDDDTAQDTDGADEGS